MEGSVYNRNILSFIPTEDIDQIKLAFTYRRLNTLGVASDGCNQLRSVVIVDAGDLGAVSLKMMQRISECWTKNDATDFLVYYLLQHFVDILQKCVLNEKAS